MAKTLDELVAKCDQEVIDLEAYRLVSVESSEDESPSGVLFDKLKRENKLEVMTGFSEPIIVRLVEDMRPLEMANIRRGPRPKSTLADSTICYLVLLKTDADYSLLATLLNLSITRTASNVNRIRPLLNAALLGHWSHLTHRPKLSPSWVDN